VRLVADLAARGVDPLAGHLGVERGLCALFDRLLHDELLQVREGDVGRGPEGSAVPAEVPPAPEEGDRRRGPEPPRHRLAPLDRVARLAVDRAVDPVDIGLEVPFAGLGERLFVGLELGRRDLPVVIRRVVVPREPGLRRAGALGPVRPFEPATLVAALIVGRTAARASPAHGDVASWAPPAEAAGPGPPTSGGSG